MFSFIVYVPLAITIVPVIFIMKQITKDDVFIVWFCKTLQNWKALVSTTIPDCMYYEITHNGDKGETYLDAYKKWENVRIPD